MLNCKTRRFAFRKTIFALMAALLLSTMTLPPPVKAASQYVANLYPTANQEEQQDAFIIQYKIDATEQKWANNDTLSITLPSGMPDWSVYSDSTYVNVSGIQNEEENIFALTFGTTKGHYSINGKTLTFHVDAVLWGSGHSSGIPTDYVFQVIIFNPAAPLVAIPNSQLVFSGTANGGGTAPNIQVSIPISTPLVAAPADAAASLVLGSNSVVGAEGVTVFHANTPEDLLSGGKISFEVPPNLDISGSIGLAIESSDFSECLVDGRTITCHVIAIIKAGHMTISITGIKALSAATGQKIASISLIKGFKIIATDDEGPVTDTTSGGGTTTSTPPTTTSTPPTTTSTPPTTTSTPPASTPTNGGGSSANVSSGGISGGFVTTHNNDFPGIVIIPSGFSLLAARNAAPTIDTDVGAVPTGAATLCAPGSLIKTPQSSAVYYCGANGSRYVFPSLAIYQSWFGNFADVKTIPTDEMSQIPLVGNVRLRPGTVMVKMQTDPKVYIVAPGGLLRWVRDEKTAMALYGTSWNKQIVDMSDAFFSNYGMGDSITM